MSIDIRLPNITASTPQEQIGEIRSYIYQLAEQLNWAFNTINDAQNTGNTSNIVINKGNGGKEALSPEVAQSTFNSLKALIIKSADIVEAFNETAIKEFNGRYFAGSDFGTYLETTLRTEIADSTGVTDVIKTVATITNPDGTGTLDELEGNVKETNAYIRRGIIDENDNGKIVGVEIGETNDNGAFIRYARFIKDRLSFFDEGGYEVAYIGQGCLYISGKAAFLGEVLFGGYKADTADGLAFTWVGGDE